MLNKPSFYSLLLTGVIWFVLVVIFVRNYSFFKKSRPDKMIEMVSLIGLVIGVHGLLHLGLESVYGFNPMIKVEQNASHLRRVDLAPPFSKVDV
jgi:hypothetical protein